MSAMSPRERLSIMVRTDRGSMTVWAPSEVREALDAFRAEVLHEAADEIEQTFIHGVAPAASERDEFWDQAVRAVAVDLRQMGDGEESSPAGADFFQPGRTYQRRRWHFQCLAVAPSPFNGEDRAVGFLFRQGEPAAATALDPDDWAHGEWIAAGQGKRAVGHGGNTAAGEAR